jgi:hypothetical protein
VAGLIVTRGSACCAEETPFAPNASNADNAKGDKRIVEFMSSSD